MILLSGHSLAKARKIPLESLSLTLTERSSTATMVPADMTGIAVGNWIQDDTDPGKGVFWRVTSVSTAYHTDTPTVQLEHVINTLRDRIMFGEYTADTAADAIQMILGFQSDWVFGGCDYNVSNPYKFDGETLYDALETVSNSLADSYWDYDLSVYPFKLYIRRKSATVGTRMRAGRNLRTISRKIDRSAMYTRFYPIGKDDLHLSGAGYVEKNTNLYGIVEKVETDSTIDSESELRRWANERLAIHAEPVVTVDVEGFELADATGESLDRIKLGAVCEIPLPEYGTTISERIVSLNYPDKVHSPELVKVQLSNTRADTQRITDIIAEAIKGGTSGRSGRASAKQAKEDHAWFEDTNDHVSMCAVGIIGVDAEGEPNWTRLAEITADGDGIHQTVTEIQGENVIRDAKIEINERAITQEVNDRTSADGVLSGRITVEADRITQEVSRATAAEGTLSSSITVEANRITSEVSRATAAEGTLSSRITQTENDITLRVTKGDVATQLSVECGNVTVSGGNLVVNGYVTATGLQAAIANLSGVTVSILEATTQVYSKGTIRADGVINAYGGIQDASGHVYNVYDASASGNTLYIYKLDGSTVTFSKAISSWTWAGGSGAITVTAQPQAQSKSVTVGLSGSNTITRDGTYTYKVMYEDASGDDQETGASMNVTVSAYSEGRKAATVTITRQDSAPETPGTSHSFSYKATNDYNTDRYAVGTVIASLAQSDGYMQMKVGTAVYAQKAIDGYHPTEKTVRLRGDAVTVTNYTGTNLGSARYFKMHSKSDTPSGTWYEAPSTSVPSGTYLTYYTSGSDYSYRDIGSVAYVYKDGGTATYYE